MARFLSFLFLVTLSTHSYCSVLWEKDYEKALKQAQVERKPLLVFFTGSDWSGWSMKMKKEILSSDKFAQKIDGKFICVEIDFPEHKTTPSEFCERNALLKETLNVHDYPRLLILTQEHGMREIARFSYSSIGGEKFADELIQITEKDTALTKAIHSLNDLTLSTDLLEYYHLAAELKRFSDAKRILDLGVIRGNLPFLLEKYRLLVEEGKGDEIEAKHLRMRLNMADPINEKGTQFSLCLIDFQNKAKGKDAKESALPLEEYLSKFGEQDLENRWRLEMMLAQIYLDCDEWKSALKHAEIAYQAAPKEHQQEIKYALDSIRSEAKVAVK